jgi:hypothetical protein
MSDQTERELIARALREAADRYRPYQRESVRDEALAVVSEVLNHISDQLAPRSSDE